MKPTTTPLASSAAGRPTGALGTQEPGRPESPLSRAQLLAVWAPHLAALLLPLVAMVFLLTAPHTGWVAFLLIAIPGAAMQLADRFGGQQLHASRPDLPAWPFDALLYLLFAIQLVNIGLLARFFLIQSFWSVDALVAILVVGASSGYSGIVVAHELIHRRSPVLQWLGRVLLCTLMYEHFYTEHLRGHHVRVGTPEDPATARFGESFTRFYVRTVPQQFRSAWRIEAKRLGDLGMSLSDSRQLRNRVLHGLTAEWSLALAIGIICGPAGFAGFLLQAIFASRALEVVNYFEHWGLTRSSKRVQPIDSWDTNSRFTYYALTGLTRHADHHAYPARPYQQLRIHDDAPVLPRGYIAMFPLVLGRNATFRRLMTEELKRRRLGPFAPGGVAADPSAEGVGA